MGADRIHFRVHILFIAPAVIPTGNNGKPMGETDAAAFFAWPIMFLAAWPARKHDNNLWVFSPELPQKED